MTDTNGRINVSEDKLNSALSQLELRLVQQIQLVVGPMTTALAAKADNRAVDDLQRRLAAVELKQAGAAAVSSVQKFWFGTVGVGVLGAIATLVWLAIGGH